MTRALACILCAPAGTLALIAGVLMAAAVFAAWMLCRAGSAAPKRVCELCGTPFTGHRQICPECVAELSAMDERISRL